MPHTTTSQTIGPFFHEGLKWAFAQPAAANASIALTGRVFDGNGAPVTDAMIEAWQPNASSSEKNSLGICRVTTDSEGCFALSLAPVSVDAGAPLAYVCVFARGLLNHQFTAVFTSDAKSNLLEQVTAVRRSTLVARKLDDSRHEWDIHLQGVNETVFFEYV